MDVQVSAASPIEGSDSLIAQPELGSILRAFGNPQLVHAFEGRHLDFRPQRGLRDVQRDGAVEVVLLPLEERVFLDLKKDVQVARRASIHARLPFSGKPKTVAVVDPRGNVDLELALDLLVPLAPAFAAGIADDLARSVARAAGTPDRKEALLINDLATPVASWARRRTAPRF